MNADYKSPWGAFFGQLRFLVVRTLVPSGHFAVNGPACFGQLRPLKGRVLFPWGRQFCDYKYTFYFSVWTCCEIYRQGMGDFVSWEGGSRLLRYYFVGRAVYFGQGVYWDLLLDVYYVWLWLHLTDISVGGATNGYRIAFASSSACSNIG